MLTRYSTYSDHELTNLLKTDDEESFSEIFNRYQALLFNFAYKKLNKQDEAKDIVQEIFVNLWNNRFEFELKTNLSSYLYRAVLNRVLNQVKHDLIREEYIVSLQQMVDQSAQASDYRIREKEIAQLVEMEIAALPQQMREVFILRRKQFFSNKEVAAQLDLSEQTVETHMKRALRVLRKRLGNLSYFFSLF